MSLAARSSQRCSHARTQGPHAELGLHAPAHAMRSDSLAAGVHERLPPLLNLPPALPHHALPHHALPPIFLPQHTSHSRK